MGSDKYLLTAARKTVSGKARLGATAIAYMHTISGYPVFYINYNDVIINRNLCKCSTKVDLMSIHHVGLCGLAVQNHEGAMRAHPDN